MKKLAAILLVVLSLALAISATAAEKKDLVIFAAASMTETMTQIKDRYEIQHPEINLVY